MGNLPSLSPRAAKIYISSPDVENISESQAKILTAARKKNWTDVTWLINNEPTLQGSSSTSVSNAIKLALQFGAPKVVLERLVERGNIKRLEADSNGDYPLSYALSVQSSVDICEYLLHIDTSQASKVDKNGNLPIHLACQHQAPLSILEALITLQPQSIKARNKNGALPLHLALDGNPARDAVEYILHLHSDAAKVSYNGNTPLHIACEHAHELIIIQKLIDLHPDSVSTLGQDGNLPLHYATAQPKTSITVLTRLIELNDEALMHRNKRGYMPLHLAIEKMISTEKVLLLCLRGPLAVRQRGRGTPGDLPLATAIEKHSKPEVIMKLLQMYPKACQQRNIYNMFPLRAAIREKLDWTLIEALLDTWPEGASEVDQHGRMAVHYAVSREFPVELIERLIRSHPASTAHFDRNHQLPLHIACIRHAPAEVFVMLLDRFAQAARQPDRHGFTPLNYLIETNAALSLYQLLIQADTQCLIQHTYAKIGQEISVTEVQPVKKEVLEKSLTLPLHHLIACNRDTDRILLALEYCLQAAEVIHPTTGQMALHMAILKPMPKEVLLAIEKAYPHAAVYVDVTGLLPIHHALVMKSDVELVRRLLATNAEIATVMNDPRHVAAHHAAHHASVLQEAQQSQQQGEEAALCCKEYCLLLHYAIAVEATPESIAVILTHTMPYRIDAGHSFNLHGHYYTWTHLLAHTQDKYWRSVEIILDDYYLNNNSNSDQNDENNDVIFKLSEFEDERRVKALDLATTRCHQALTQRLFYHGRYEFVDVNIDFFHRSKLSMIRFGRDHRPNVKAHSVALKFFTDKIQFANEVFIRQKVELSDRFIVACIASYNGDDDYDYRVETQRKRLESYPYLIVTSRMRRTLLGVILHDNIAEDWDRIRMISAQLLACLKHIHGLGVIHTNLSPSDIYEDMYDGSIKIGNFSRAVWSTRDEKLVLAANNSNQRTSRAIAYAPPELAELYLNRIGEDQAQEMVVDYTLDMWSVGAILFYLSTGEALLHALHDNSIDREQIQLLAAWQPAVRLRRLKQLNGNAQVRNLVAQMLQMDPAMRPAAGYILHHPFLFSEVDSKPQEVTMRFVGQSPQFGLYLMHRWEEMDKLTGANDMLHQQLLSQELQAQFTIASSSDDVADTLSEVVMKNSFLRMTQSRSVAVLLSRYAINSHGLNIGILKRTSELSLFLFELRLAFELKSQGLLEGGIALIAIGDVQHSKISDQPKYSLFFPKFDNDKDEAADEPATTPKPTTKKGNCMPEKIPDIVVTAVEDAVAKVLLDHGLGKLFFPNMAMKDLFHKLIQCPTIDLRGLRTQAFSAAATELSTMIIGRAASSRAWSRSRPGTTTSRYQRTLEARIASPDINSNVQASWFASPSKGGAASVSSSPTKGLLLSDFVETNSLDNPVSPLARLQFSPDQRQEHAIEEGGDEEATVNTEEFVKREEPYFTEIVGNDKAQSEELLRYYLKRGEAKETEVYNLKQEMALMEERMRKQLLEMNRLRRLVKVTSVDVDV